ncbi:MAG: hypothetical protein ABIA92_02575 [Patescibacteria group bacterium]
MTSPDDMRGQEDGADPDIEVSAVLAAMGKNLFRSYQDAPHHIKSMKRVAIFGVSREPLLLRDLPLALRDDDDVGEAAMVAIEGHASAKEVDNIKYLSPRLLKIALERQHIKERLVEAQIEELIEYYNACAENDFSDNPRVMPG